MDKIGLFSIYRSSAGSGKTRTLAKEYLTLALRFRSDYFKHILAVTFTNKSTQEMKNRIIDYLNDFAEAKPNPLADELCAELNLKPDEFRLRAIDVRSAILHGYHQFSISTIDAFFQRVIRSFTREAGILGDYRLEVDHDEIFEDVIENLIGELGTRPQLTRWMVDLALNSLENERSWDMRKSLLQFSKELTREEFKLIQPQVEAATNREAFATEALRMLESRKHQFVKFVQERAETVYKDFRSRGLSADDFKYKSRGSVFTFFERKASLFDVKGFVKDEVRAQGEFLSAENWIVKTHPRYRELTSVITQKWLPLLEEIMSYRQQNLTIAFTSEVILTQFYLFGLLADLLRKLNDYKRENNIMLLADAAQFLHRIIDESDTPFIYEKAGSFFRNYLIDEFQDTSELQWANLQPLVANSLDSGYPSLIVGDVKQAIYRWRGGNQDLLQSRAEQNMGSVRTTIKNLNQNFRSAPALVNFNNTLFRNIVRRVELNGDPLPEYADVEQRPARTGEGFVQVQFFEGTEEGSWTTDALRATAACIERWQQAGALPEEIALLVRTNDEGEKIISYLIEHSQTAEAAKNVVYDVISSDSLRVGNAVAVQLLEAAMRYLLHPDDHIARATLAHSYKQWHHPEMPNAELFASCPSPHFETLLPPRFAAEKVLLKKLPLFELTETLVDIFSMNDAGGEMPYLLAFQDIVLEFAHRERNDLTSFLSWWEDIKHKKFVVAPAQANAMRLFTLHKAKGLQFKFVIIPFCSWSLDHDSFGKSNILWEKAGDGPLESLGYVPVRYSSSLDQTVFRDRYLQEHHSALVDNINLLYVAFTRAEQGLAVFAPALTERNAAKSVAQLVHDALSDAAEWTSLWSPTTEQFRIGNEKITPSLREEQINMSSLTAYDTGTWRTKLVLKHSPHDSSIDVEQRRRMNFGIILHAALARVVVAADVRPALQRLVNDGTIPAADIDAVEKMFAEALENPMVAEWFSDQWTVQNEVTILLPDQQMLRIDRLLTREKKAIVIDFKTGEPKKQDQHQVHHYTKVLTQMGYESEGYLLYLVSGDVVPVLPPGKPKKKNTQQLGFDF